MVCCFVPYSMLSMSKWFVVSCVKTCCYWINVCCLLLLNTHIPSSPFTVYGTTLNVFRPTVFSENLMVFHCSEPGYCIEECWIWADFRCGTWSCSFVRNYRGADKSLAGPTSQYILFYGENILFYASLVIYINSTNIPPIMIINRIYENQNLLSL
jgi:hypothetical protein